MSPEVFQRKIQKLLRYHTDLSKHKDVSFEVFMDHHYEIERLLQLLNEVASDIISHELAKKEMVGSSYRETFANAVKTNILSKDLGEELILASGMRNILTHDYDEINYTLVHQAIPSALKLYSRLLKLFSTY